MAHESWPALRYAEWRDTCASLHLRAQVVGKIRLALTPWQNHSWHATLYPSVRGLTTGPIPYRARTFRIELDFFEHRLFIEASDEQRRSLPLKEQSIANFYADVLADLKEIGIDVRIHGKPSEVPDPVPFAEDREHRAYDPRAVTRFWHALSSRASVMQEFRTGFLGKSSPVHFFWGSFDLAVTRFSGRRAPRHPGGVPGLPDAITREAYSHEVCSAGFWPGGGGYDDAAFYCYAYPEPAGFASARVRPAAAVYDTALREFILPYEAVRTARDPRIELLAFLQSSYDAAATLGGWDRAALDCEQGVPGVPRRVD